MQYLIFLFCLLYLASSQTMAPCPVYPDIVGNLPNMTGLQPCSYAGYAPVNNESALYYWYFPRSNNQSTSPAPIVVFLGGGPGVSSIASIFLENGPLRMSENSDGGWSIWNADEPVGQSWSYSYDVIWIDNPVGAGFAYTNNSNYSSTLSEVAHNLWTAFQYILNVHNETQTQDWYISGESFAGRYVPYVTKLILENNQMIQNNSLQGIYMNVKGMIVGDGYVHGVGQRLAMLAAAQAVTLINSDQVNQVRTLEAECQVAYANKSANAYLACNQILNYLIDVSGIDLMSLLWPSNITDNLTPGLVPYLSNSSVQIAINAVESPFTGFSTNAYNALTGEILGTSVPQIDYVLTQIPCMFYAGNFDARDGAMSQYVWFELLNAPYYKIVLTNREIWYMNGNPVGFHTQYENMHSVIINFAGHFPPVFKLAASVQMLDNFIGNLSWFDNSTQTPSATIMCNAMRNCHGHGKCNEIGLCECNSDRALADCSMPIHEILQMSSYTIQPREFLFLQIELGTFDQFILLEGENGFCKVLYTGTSQSPALDYDEADAGLVPQPNLYPNRYFYLSATGQSYGFLTFQNSNYNQEVSFKITIYTDKSGYFLADVSTINWVFGLFVLSLLMIGISMCLFFNHEKKKFDEYHASFEQPDTFR